MKWAVLTAVAGRASDAIGRRHAAFPHGNGAGGADEPVIRLGATFRPERPTVAVGQPVRLTFHRDADNLHCDAVLFPELGRLFTLPLDVDVPIDLGPLALGEYHFHCPLGAPAGTLIVTAGAEPARGAEPVRSPELRPDALAPRR